MQQSTDREALMPVLNYLSMGIGGLAGALLIASALTIYNYTIENPGVRADERMRIEAAARQRALDLIEKRSQDNVEISNMDLAELCAELGGRWIDREQRCD